MNLSNSTPSVILYMLCECLVTGLTSSFSRAFALSTAKPASPGKVSCLTDHRDMTAIQLKLQKKKKKKKKKT
jgi:hypothetical protein